MKKFKRRVSRKQKQKRSQQAFASSIRMAMALFRRINWSISCAIWISTQVRLRWRRWSDLWIQMAVGFSTKIRSTRSSPGRTGQHSLYYFQSTRDKKLHSQHSPLYYLPSKEILSRPSHCETGGKVTSVQSLRFTIEIIKWTQSQDNTPPIAKLTTHRQILVHC